MRTPLSLLKPMFRSSLRDQFPGASGAEYAVPALSVLFAFFLVSFVGFLFFSEHRFNTWDRMLASQARPSEIMLGKVAPPFVLARVSCRHP